MGKIITIDQLYPLRRTVALAHGVFDIPHVGHIRYLQQAKRLAADGLLFVTITSDRFVNKGPGRPFFPAELRAEALAALECVDFVAINPGPNACRPIELLRPDFFVKGPECRDKKTPGLLAEIEAVQRFGGRVEYTDGEIFSSTAIGQKVLAIG